MLARNVRKVRLLVSLFVAVFVLSLVAAPSVGALGPNAVRDVDGFNDSTVPANDDGSTDQVSIGFSVNFFGQRYDQLYVNNNGNVTFDEELPTYTPFTLDQAQRIIIAAFFADVDTRAGNTVKYGRGTVDGRRAFGVNSIDVGYYSRHVDKLNNFQMILIDRSDVGDGDFDIEFNYDRVTWETGDASGGRDGLGGNPVRVGYSNGSGGSGTSYELPGSGESGALLDSNPSTGLIHNSLNSNQLGRYIFQVRGGNVVEPEPEPTPGPERERERRADPAQVTVVQRPTPNLVSSRSEVDFGISSFVSKQAVADGFPAYQMQQAVADDGIVEYVIEVTNRGQGNASDTVVTMPFDPAAVRVLDAAFTQEGAYVSSVLTNTLEFHTGRILSSGIMTATIRLLTRPDVPDGTSLAQRLSFTWSDDRSGGSGTSNQTILVVGASDNHTDVYPMTVYPTSAAVGTAVAVGNNIFVPGEPVALWYNAPSGEAVALGTYTADGDGFVGDELITADVAPGDYSVVAQGLWSGFVSLGSFTLE